MSTQRTQRRARRPRQSPVAELRRALTAHLLKYPALYIPVAMPVVLFFLAHLLTLFAVFGITAGFLSHDQGLHKSALIWAVYGFRLLLPCSYAGFFAVAKPVTRILTNRYSQWPPLQLTLAGGAAYGLAICLILLALLGPSSPGRVLLLLFIGMTTGIGNWYIYRRLVGPEQPETKTE